jgi:hypothetical protein
MTAVPSTAEDPDVGRRCAVAGTPRRPSKKGKRKTPRRAPAFGVHVTNIGCLNPSVVITAFLNAIAFVIKPRLKMTKSSRKEMSWT